MARLSWDAFPGHGLPQKEREARITRSTLGTLRDRIVCEDDGRVVGQLALFPMKLWMGGVRLSMGGVAGVAVAPEARRSGVAPALMQEALGRMRARGDVISLLYPFKHDFYRHFGYGLIGERHYFEIPPAALAAHPERRRVRAVRRTRYPLVFRCYERMMRRSSGWLERSKPRWEDLLREPETRVYGVWDSEGEALTGYMICDYDTRGEHARLRVLEHAAEDEASLRALVGMLSGMREQVRSVRLYTSPEERFSRHLVECQGPERAPMSGWGGFSPTAKVAYGYMGRVLDPQAALSQRAYQPCEPLRAAFTVRDPSLPGGQVTATLALGAHGQPPGRKPEGLRVALNLPVDLFSQGYFGYLPWSLLAQDPACRLKSAEGLAELDHAFAGPLPSMRDFF